MPSQPSPATAAELLAATRAWAVANLGSTPTRVILHLHDGSRHVLRPGASDSPIQQPAPPAGDASPYLPSRRHGPDFRSVVWDGVTYHFNELQSAVVKLLWEAMVTGGDVGKRVLLAAARPDYLAESQELRDVFKLRGEGGRMHPAWRVMIVEGHTRGTYRLAD